MAAAHVQDAITAGFSDVDSTTASFPAPVAAGNTIVVCVWGYHNAAFGAMFPDGCVTDSEANTYTKVAERAADANVSCAIFYAYNVVGGSITITLDPLTSGNYGNWSASEFSGLTRDSDPHDRVSSATANNPAATTSTTGTTTTRAHRRQLVVAVMASVNNKASITVETASPRWRQIAEELSYDNYNPGESVYRFVDGTAGQVCNWSYVGAGREAAVIATFREENYQSLVSDTPGLVSYWRMEDTGTQTDSFGTNPLTPVGALVIGEPTLVLSLPGGRSALYSGSPQRHARLDNATLDLGDVVSIEAWVRPASIGAYMGILSKGSGAYYLRIANSGHVQFLASQVAVLTTSTVTLSANTTYHVVATKDGSDVHLYVDGVDVTGAVTNTTLVNTSAALAVAADSFGAGGAEYFSGRLDELALYNVAVPSATVLAHYEVGSTAPWMGSARSRSSASGRLTQRVMLAGAARSRSGASAALSRQLALSGSASGRSSAGGALSRALQLSGSALSRSSAFGELTVADPFVSSISGKGMRRGTITGRGRRA